MCGLPSGCTSPLARSTAVGFSSSFTCDAAMNEPGVPGATFVLPDWRISIGSQPTSSSAPVQTTRSAARTCAIRLGLASITCTSCRADVPTLTSTLSPVSSCTSEPHSGSHAKTFIFACAGDDTSAAVSSNAGIAKSFIGSSSEFVRAVRAQAGLVLNGDGVVAVVGIGLVVAELQADQAELAVAPGEFRGVAIRIEIVRDLERIAGIRPQAVVAITDVPGAVEAVDALEIGAAALAVPEHCDRRIGRIDEGAVAIVEDVFAAQGDAAILGVAVGRPLPGAVGDVKRGVAAESVVGVVGLRFQHRYAGQPRAFRTHVATGMREQRARADAAVLGAAAGETLAAKEFATELEEQRGRRHPTHLHAIVAVLVAEERLVRQRPVEEVVGVRVVAVEITDVGIEPTGADAEVRRQGGCVDERFLDADVVLPVLALGG